MEKSEKIGTLKRKIKSLEKAEKECRKSESELQKNRSKLNQIQQIARIGQWEFNFSDSVLAWSDGVYSIFNENPKKFKVSYKSYLDLVHPEDRKLVDGSFTQSVMKKSWFNISFRLFLRDKSVKHVISICKTYYDDTGKPLRSLGTIQDITKLKNIERELKERENYYRIMLNHLQEEMIVIDKDYKIVDVNSSFLNKFGYNRNEVIGKYCYNITHGYDLPCDKKGDDCKFGKLLKSGQSYNSLHRYLQKDGTKFWADLLLSPLKDNDGNINYIIESARDVTDLMIVQEELKISEERYRGLFESAPMGITLFDKDGVIIDTNSAYADLTGYQKKEITGKHISDFLKNELKYLFEENLPILKKKGKIERETVLIKKNGSEIAVWRAANALYENGKFAGAIVHTQDIRNLKKMEDELKALNKDLESKVREKTSELNERVDELERFRDATIERELRMKELRDRINELEMELKKYKNGGE